MFENVMALISVPAGCLARTNSSPYATFIHFDQHIALCVNVDLWVVSKRTRSHIRQTDLHVACLVQRAVDECEQLLDYV